MRLNAEKDDRAEMQEIQETAADSSPDSSDAASRKQAHTGKKPRLKAIVVLAVLVLTATSAFVYRFFAGWESTDDAQIDGYINPVSSRVAGYITEVYVDDN